MNPRRRQSATIASMLLVEFEIAPVIAAPSVPMGKRGQYANRSRATTTVRPYGVGVGAGAGTGVGVNLARSVMSNEPDCVVEQLSSVA